MRQQKWESTDDVVCTVLYDNVSMTDSVIADHGFSCLIESGGHSCLFDAGRIADKFMTNVSTLGVDCARIDHVFISHVHDDHMGGLLDILAKCNRPSLYMPFSYPRQEGESLGDQADKEYAAMLDQLRPLVCELTQPEEPAKIGGNFYTTGVVDKKSYEQALMIPTSRGLMIITGCAHPGITEIVRRAKELTGLDVYFVMGGFHLFWSDSSVVETVARELRQLTKYVGPCHCTGEKAQGQFKEIFGEDYVDVQAGLKLRLGEGKLR